MFRFRNHVRLHYKSTALVLVALVGSMERLVCQKFSLQIRLLIIVVILIFLFLFLFPFLFCKLDVHLDCEARIAEFLGTPDSILYSYGLSTMFSAIPAFAKKGDIIVA